MFEVNSEIKKTIFVVAVSNNQDSSTNLLNSVFSGLQSTDSQEWSGKSGDAEVRAYIKYPDCDVHRRVPIFADVVIGAVGSGDKEELDVLNFISSRTDARYRLLVDSNKERPVADNVRVVETSEAEKLVNEYGVALLANTFEDDDHLLVSRREFALGDDNKSGILGKQLRNLKSLDKVIGLFEKTITDFAVETTKWESQNKAKFEFTPESGEGNGVGFSLEINSGDEFAQQNPHLPITVRDNPATLTLELYAKDSENADEVIKTLENAKQMGAQFGLLQLLESSGLTLTFSKDGASVFVDLTIGGILGEGLIGKIRRLNLERFKFSLKDSLRVSTNVNLKDLYDNTNLKKVAEDFSKFSIVGEGHLLNIRGFLHLLRDLAKLVNKDKTKKAYNMISYGVLILTSFENFGLEIKYDSDELLKVGYEIAASLLGLEDSSQAEGMLDGLSETIKNGLLPMGLQQVEAIKPMLEAFPGLKFVNFDKISAELVLPSVRSEIKFNVNLTGLTEFLEKNVLN